MYDVSSGQDIVYIDGGSGVDALTINERAQSFTVRDANGNILYQQGVSGTTITIADVENGSVVGADGIVLYQW
jgi:hypothetical protein